MVGNFLICPLHIITISRLVSDPGSYDILEWTVLPGVIIYISRRPYIGSLVILGNSLVIFEAGGGKFLCEWVTCMYLEEKAGVDPVSTWCIVPGTCSTL